MVSQTKGFNTTKVAFWMIWGAILGTLSKVSRASHKPG